MTDSLYWIFGAIILLLVTYDFFFTTLSGSGAAIITRFVSMLSQKILKLGVKFFGRKVYNLSGVLINLMMLTVWVVLMWLGLYLVFSSSPEAVISEDDRPASALERLYFIGYTISTLGIGDFRPKSGVFQILTSCFSFFGFIFFTTSMTYLISVTSAAMHKRSLALTIYNLGTDPEEIADTFDKTSNSFCLNKISDLQQMIDKHTVNHQAYPVLHFYSNPEVTSSFSLNISRLDEAINILLNKPNELSTELLILRKSLSQFLNYIELMYDISLKSNIDIEGKLKNLPSIDEINEDEGGGGEASSQQNRRRILAGLLDSESFNLNDIYTREKT